MEHVGTVETLGSFTFNQHVLRSGLALNLLAADAPDEPVVPVVPARTEVDEEDTDDVPRSMACPERFGTDLEYQGPCCCSSYNLHAFRLSNIAMADSITSTDFFPNNFPYQKMCQPIMMFDYRRGRCFN